LAAGFRPDPRSHRPPSWIEGVRFEAKEGEGEETRREMREEEGLTGRTGKTGRGQ